MIWRRHNPNALCGCGHQRWEHYRATYRRGTFCQVRGDCYRTCVCSRFEKAS